MGVKHMENKDKPQQELNAAGHTENYGSNANRVRMHPRSHIEQTIQKRQDYKLRGGSKEQNSQDYRLR
jgi:hypothetical protein